MLSIFVVAAKLLMSITFYFLIIISIRNRKRTKRALFFAVCAATVGVEVIDFYEYFLVGILIIPTVLAYYMKKPVHPLVNILEEKQNEVCKMDVRDAVTFVLVEASTMRYLIKLIKFFVCLKFYNWFRNND